MSVSEELLDVVDAEDRVVAVKTRGEIHALGLMHRAVHILVFNSRGELFLQKRSMRKDENPGLWDSSAAGHVDSGEDYLACAHRELAEELGIIEPVELLELFRMPATLVTGFEHCVVYRAVYDGEMTLQPEEIDAGDWLAPQDMDARVNAGDPDFTNSLVLIWRKYRQLDPGFTW